MLVLKYRVVGAAVAHFVYTERVIGSNPIQLTSGDVAQWLARLLVTQEVAGSSPVIPAIKVTTFFIIKFFLILFSL